MKKINKNANAKYEIIAVSQLKICKYQRAMQMVRAKKCAGAFNIDLVGTIIVSEREGNYYVIDGQHRTFIAKLAGVTTLMCQVLQGKTYEEEADLFVELNTTTKKLKKVDIFNANVEAKDKETLDILSIVKSVGFVVSKVSCNNSISAVNTLEAVYKKYGSEHLRETLTLIKKTWDGATCSLSSKMITGVASFIKIYNQDTYYTREIFIKQLQKVEAIVIIREANADFSSSKLETRTVNMIYRHYNLRLKKKLTTKHFM